MIRSNTRRRFMVATGIAVHAGLSALDAAAQPAFPQRPVRIVVPFTPGGFTDLTARILAQELSDRLGVPFVVDNKPGGGTVLGAEAVAKAQPDGYTLLFAGASTFTVNPVLLRNLPYDPLSSFVPVGIAARTAMVLMVHPSFPATSVKELVALASASPGKYAYGSFGAGTISHFAGEAFKSAVGVQMLHVPYKGSAPMMNDLVGGQIPVSFDTVVVAAPQVRAGKARALAVLGKDRATMFPQVPTVAEAGYSGVDFSTWLALLAPAGTPEGVVRKLREEVTAVVAKKSVVERFEALGVEAAVPSAEGFVRTVQTDLQRFAKIAKDSDIKAE